ncbi:hypothetical protein Hanom_Chr15g01401731 [Helianthus anomalus]
MELEAESEIMKGFIDQGVNWLFLKVWGKTIKVTKPHGAKRKFIIFTKEIFLYDFLLYLQKNFFSIFLNYKCYICLFNFKLV